MNKLKILFVSLFASCVFSAASLADLTTWAPGTFRMVGVVDLVKQDTLIIDDRKYQLSPTVKMIAVGNNNASTDNLKPGQMLGFNTIKINNRELIDQIWIIPKQEYTRYRPML